MTDKVGGWESRTTCHEAESGDWPPWEFLAWAEIILVPSASSTGRSNSPSGERISVSIWPLTKMATVVLARVKPVTRILALGVDWGRASRVGADRIWESGFSGGRESGLVKRTASWISKGMPNLTTRVKRAAIRIRPQRTVLTARFCSTRRRRER